jgi:hypothetical protein
MQRRDDAEAAREARQRADYQATINSMTPTPADTGPMAAQPKISVKGGKIQPGTKVTLTCATPGAVIYYSANGWTPTTSSRRYSGPITIHGSTVLEAFAAAPHMANSVAIQAKYTVTGPEVPVFPLVLPADGVLRAKSRLHLVTGAAISSKNAKVGDKIDILLDQDIKVGDAVAIPKGTPVNALLTTVQPSRVMGQPGSITFAAQSLSVSGAVIPLQGGERLDGVSHTTRTVLLWVTFVGSIPAVMEHGGQAEIKPGMKFTVGVATDTPLLKVASAAN